jgi:hypothetical protein
MSTTKPTYKEQHGTTRVGDFLRSIGKSELLTKVISSGSDLITGNISGALKNLLKSTDELTPEQREYALKLLESDVKENEEVSKRWQYDMNSDSWLSKNIRPLMLLYLTLAMSIFCVLDSCVIDFNVHESWISLLETLLLTSYVAYFGGRSYEKTKKL